MKHVAVALLLVAAALVRGQSNANAPGAVLSGRVVAADNGEPIRNARIAVARGQLGTTVVLTDADGGFSVAAPAGPFTLSISKPGFARQTITGGRSGMEVRLERGAAISGRIVDEFGDPVIDAPVIARTVTSRGAPPDRGQATSTDDNGEYRIGNLPAGTFTVQVLAFTAPVPQRVGNLVVMEPGEQRFYYPATTSADDAERLAIAAGEERDAIDLTIPGNFSGAFLSYVASVIDAGAARGSPAATGVIRGRVTNTDGRPLARAIVRLFQQPPIPLQSVRTGIDGAFELTGVGAGRYRLGAAKPGYTAARAVDAITMGAVMLSDFGAGPPIDIADGETREHSDVTLARLGTVAGQILDELGDPVEGAAVHLLRVEYQAGQRRLVSSNSRTTDDRGRYRLFNVRPGRYVVSASVGAVASADVPGYARSYFPGTISPAEAQFITVAASQDVGPIDIQLARTRTARIAGQILDSAGQPSRGGNVSLRPSVRSGAVTSVPVGARLESDGRFEFPNVPPGQYVIHVDRGRRNGMIEGEFAAVPVAVSGADVTDLIVQTSSGSTISGRITFSTFDRSSAPSPQSVEISPMPVDFDLAPSNVAAANVHSDGTFEMHGINGPRRLQVQRAPDGWALDDIRVHGVDVTDRPLQFGRASQSLSDVEVVLTDRINRLVGRVSDDQSQPVSGTLVVCFAADRDRWFPASRFLRSATTDADGAFAVAGLPPGTYYIAPARAPDEGPDAWQDRGFLESLLPRAIAVTFGVGDTQRVTVRKP